MRGAAWGRYPAVSFSLTMTLEPEPLAIGDLVLSRLVPGHTAGLPTERLRGDLFPFVAHALSEMQWDTRLRDLLEVLGDQGLVAGTATGVALTDAGRRRALVFLGLDEVPPLVNWRALLCIYVVPRALGLSGRNEATFAEGIRVAILRRHYSLPLAAASLREVRDALAWHEIGFDRSDAFIGEAVAAAVLSRALGLPRVTDADAALRQLAAHAVGARMTDVEALRIAAVRRVVRLDMPAPAAGDPRGR